MKPIKFSLFLSLSLGFCQGVLADIDNVELRIGDSLPPEHIITKELTNKWMDKVKELSEGKISFKYFPAEQAGKVKNLLTLTQTGVLDIGYIGATYVSDKMPLTGVTELPGLFSSSCEVTKAYWPLAKEGGFFYENEYKSNKVRPLFMLSLPPYKLNVSKKKEVASISDLKGMKIRAAGGAQERSLQQLDLVPIKMAPPEIYESMSRGTIDGTLLPYISVDSYKLSSLLDSTMIDANFGSVAITYSISDRTWEALSKDTQELLIKVGDEVTLSACEAFDNAEIDNAKKLDELGVKLVKFSSSDQEVFESMADSVAQTWSERLDKRNRPGSETLEVFKKALKAVK